MYEKCQRYLLEELKADGLFVYKKTNFYLNFYLKTSDMNNQLCFVITKQLIIIIVN